MSQVLRLAPKPENQDSTDGRRSVAVDEQVHHMWVSHSSFFTTDLLILPETQASAEKDGGAEEGSKLFTASLEFFDADGYKFNESGVACPSDRALTLSLKSFMESCKLESGWKHAHLQVRSKFPARFICKFSDKTRTTFYSPVVNPEFRAAHAFPVQISAIRKNVFCFVSGESDEAKVKLRLFIGKRKPECDIVIPPNGVTVVSLEDCFPEFCGASDAAEAGIEGGAQRMQAYLRLSTPSPSTLSVYTLKQNGGRGGQPSYSCEVLL